MSVLRPETPLLILDVGTVQEAHGTSWSEIAPITSWPRTSCPSKIVRKRGARLRIEAALIDMRGGALKMAVRLVDPTSAIGPNCRSRRLNSAHSPKTKSLGRPPETAQLVGDETRRDCFS